MRINYYYFFSEAKRTRKALALGSGLAMIFALLSLFSLQAAKPAHAAAPFTVNSTADAGDDNPGNGSCFTGTLIPGGGFGVVRECTLRAAIEEANANDNHNNTDAFVVDAIQFGIPGVGPHTISPATALPVITEPVTIDGYTQPGASVNTATIGTNAVLKIVLNGSNAPDTAAGLRMTTGGTGGTVKGLVINGFSTGVILDVFDPDSQSRLEGNFIGTDATGTRAIANRRSGVYVLRCTHFIGGDTLAARNLISGNGLEGIKMGSNACGNVVEGNLIGTKKDGTTALGNGFFGVAVGGGNQIWRNTIAFNGGHGVFVSFGNGNAIHSNSIHSNGGLGIDLRGGTENADGATANDPGDPDAGPNHLQNKPIITDAITSGTTTNISGRLNSLPNQLFFLQFFSNPPGGNEGQRFIGAQGVKTDDTGNVRFTFAPARKVPVGRTITVTAMLSDDTSEFSAPRTVGAVIGP